jgi:hypothetical protein
MASPAKAIGVRFATDGRSQFGVDINLRFAGSRETSPRLRHVPHADKLVRSYLCGAIAGAIGADRGSESLRTSLRRVASDPLRRRFRERFGEAWARLRWRSR